MRRFRPLAYLFIALFTGVSNASTDCSEWLGHCGYYACLNSRLKCRSGTYLRRFGEKYCRVFEKDRELYSAQGRAFMDQVRNCLQAELDSEFKTAPDLSCDNVESRAAQHHVRCYLDNGYCSLSASDQWRIQSTIFWDVLFRRKLWAAAAKISETCAPSEP